MGNPDNPNGRNMMLKKGREKIENAYDEKQLVQDKPEMIGETDSEGDREEDLGCVCLATAGQEAPGAC